IIEFDSDEIDEDRRIRLDGRIGESISKFSSKKLSSDDILIKKIVNNDQEPLLNEFRAKLVTESIG
ncbi:unnamed protein product, partial [Rotaria magnacalcarata]